jgi:hypothetical protein
MVPENPPRLDNVIVEEPFEPNWKPTVDGLGDAEKSAMLTVIWTECATPLLVPVTVKVYVPPMDDVTETVEIPDPPLAKVRLTGLKEAERPEGVETDVRTTVPANPPRLPRVMVELPAWPAMIFRLVGLAEMEKSTTLTVSLKVRVIEPPVAVKVTV